MLTEHTYLLERLSGSQPNERALVLEELSECTQRLVASTGRGLDLCEADLSGLNLAGANLRRATLSRASLHNTNLRDADLSEITMVCPGMERTDLRGANLESAYVHALAAQTCNFDDANLSRLRDATGTLFHGCSMRGVQLSSAQLAYSSFYQCDLSGGRLSGANLQGCLINECLLIEASLEQALLDQLSIVKSDLSAASSKAPPGRDCACSASPEPGRYGSTRRCCPGCDSTRSAATAGRPTRCTSLARTSAT